MHTVIGLATQAGLILAAALLIFAAVIGCTRAVGLRSFSKMSSFDFAMTIAVGSVIATGVMGPRPPVLQALLALIMLFAVQAAIARARRLAWFQNLIDNEPVLLMTQDRMLEANMRRCKVTQDDLRAKLREANVLRQSEVRAVVLETTGDISVLHGPPPDENGAGIEDWLLEGVRR